MTKLATDEFVTTGLAPSYAFVLMTVNDDPGIQIGDIAAIMQLEPSTVTRFVEKLERKKLLNRQKEGRKKTVHPTVKGMQKQDALKKAWRSLYNTYARMLGDKSAKDLTTAIYQANQQLDSY